MKKPLANSCGAGPGLGLTVARALADRAVQRLNRNRPHLSGFSAIIWNTPAGMASNTFPAYKMD